MIEKRLNRCKLFKKNIERIEERIIRLKSDMTRITPLLELSGVSAGSMSDKMLSQLSKLEDMNDNMIDSIIKLQEELNEMEIIFDKLPDNQALIMKLYYCDGLSWEKVSKKTLYSIQHCKRLRKKALEYLNVETK